MRKGHRELAIKNRELEKIERPWSGRAVGLCGMKKFKLTCSMFAGGDSDN